MKHFLDSVTNPIGFFGVTGRRAVVSDAWAPSNGPVAATGLAFERSAAEYGDPIELSYFRTGAVKDPDHHGADVEIYVVWPRPDQTPGPDASREPNGGPIDSYDRAFAAHNRLATEARRSPSPTPTDYPATADEALVHEWEEAKAEVARRLTALTGEPYTADRIHLVRTGPVWDWRCRRYRTMGYGDPLEPNFFWAGREYHLRGLAEDVRAAVLCA